MERIRVKLTSVDSWVSSALEQIQQNAESGVSNTLLFAPNPKRGAFREYQQALNKALDKSGTKYEYVSMFSPNIGHVTKAISVGDRIKLKIRIL